jgi:hypothetical protein
MLTEIAKSNCCGQLESGEKEITYPVRYIRVCVCVCESYQLRANLSPSISVSQFVTCAEVTLQ